MKKTVFIFAFILSSISCSEKVDMIDYKGVTLKTQDYTSYPKFVYKNHEFYKLSDNTLAQFENSNFQFERTKFITDEILTREYIDENGYSIVEFTTKSRSNDALMVRKKSFDNGIYTFDLINPNGISLYDVQYYDEYTKGCPWCWLVAPALGVISEVIEALDDTVTEDCAQYANEVCGANGVHSVTTTEPTDGGIFGNDTPGSCEIICND